MAEVEHANAEYINGLLKFVFKDGTQDIDPQVHSRDSLICPNCSSQIEIKDWLAQGPWCDDCEGRHLGLECPICGKAFDYLYDQNTTFTIIRAQS